jgi:hypothetical protein
MKHTSRIPADISKELQTIPGVGVSVAQDLYDLGIRRVADLRTKNPQTLYDQLCILAGQHIDRCMLYTFRCAVYFSSRTTHDPELLKWWNWMDKEGTTKRRK